MANESPEATARQSFVVEEAQNAYLIPTFSERDGAARFSAKQKKAKHFRGYSRELGRLESQETK